MINIINMHPAFEYQGLYTKLLINLVPRHIRKPKISKTPKSLAKQPKVRGR